MSRAVLALLATGLLAGAAARLLVPGRHGLGLLTTVSIGVLGTLVAGLVTGLVRGEGPALVRGGVLASVVASAAILLVLRRVGATGGRRSTPDRPRASPHDREGRRGD